MTNLGAFLIINLAFAGAQVVAVGVFRVLSDLVFWGVPDSDLAVLPWIVIGIASAGAALLFLRGLLEAGNSMIKTVGCKP